MEKIKHLSFFLIEDPVSINYLLSLCENKKNKIIVSCKDYTHLKNFKLKIKIIKNIRKLKSFLIKKQVKKIFLCSTESNNSISKKILLFSNVKKIHSTLVIDSKDNIKKRIFFNNKKLPADRIVVPDLLTKRKYLEYGFKNIIVKNFINQKFLKSELKILKKRKKLRKIVTFCTVPKALNISKDSFLPGYDFKIKDKMNAAIEEFIFSFCKYNKDIKFHKVLRYHPKNKKNEFFKYHWFFDEISINRNPLIILKNSDYIFGETTSFLIDGALLSKKVFSILPIPDRQNILDYKYLKNKIYFIKNKKKLDKIVACI
jgi:hypothetical protein